MRPSFNVLDAPWIPVVGMDGNRELLGIRDTLRRSPELMEISAVSPLEEFSVYRFLSVFLMDALRPKRSSTIKKLLKQGYFDMEQIEEYISICESEGVSFDLFDEKRPFMQSPYVQEWDKVPEPVSRLDFAQPTGNNHTHFVHEGEQTVRISCAEAFRKLLSCYVFATQGGRGYSPSINGTPPYMVLVTGDNLFRTLCFQMVPMGEYDIGDVHPAIWPKDPIAPEKEFTYVDFFHGMFFPVRRICLIPEDDGNGVACVHYNSGYKFSGGDAWTDPNVAYSRNKEGKRYPLRPNLEVGVWRNYSELVREIGRPEVISRYCKYDLGWDYAAITLYGLQAEQATCENIFRHSIRIPRPILQDEYKADVLKDCISAADDLARVLNQALRKALQHEKEKKGKQAGKVKKPNAKVRESVVTFYSKCEDVFWGVVEDVATKKRDDVASVHAAWMKCISEIALNEYSMAVNSIGASGKVLSQIVDGETYLLSSIRLLQRGNE